MRTRAVQFGDSKAPERVYSYGDEAGYDDFYNRTTAGNDGHYYPYRRCTQRAATASRLQTSTTSKFYDCRPLPADYTRTYVPFDADDKAEGLPAE